MDIKQIRNRYFLYVILNTFTQSLFFAFGALLIYSKTHSILWVLLYNLVADTTSVIIKSVGFNVITKNMRRWGFAPVMTLGLFMKILSFVIIFLITNTTPSFYIILILMGIIGHLGSATYNAGNSTLMLEVIGISRSPGFSAAQIDILKTLSGLLAIVVGIVLNHYGLFNFLFLAGAFMLLISALPLYGIPSPQAPEVNFKANLKTVPWSMIFANFNPDHEIQVTGISLIILLASLSLHLSVEVTASIAAFSIMLSYITGKFIDKNNTKIIYIALLFGIVAWSLYIFVKTPLGFIIPGIIITLVMSTLTLYREARMGSFMQKQGNYLNNTFAIEFVRSCGGVFATLLMLILYLLFENLSKDVLAMSWIFLLPLAYYGICQTKNNLTTVPRVKNIG